MRPVRLLTFLLLCAPAFGQVVFDATNATGGRVSAGTTCSVTATIGSGSNRAAAVLIGWNNNGETSIAATIGGTTATLVSGSDSTSTRTYRSAIYALANPTSGSQSFSVTWTNAASAVCFPISVTGADQTTPMNNGAFGTAGTPPETKNVSSNSGDLTVDIANAESGAIPTAPSQTSRSTRQSGDFLCGGGVSTGPGTAGPITHSWTTGSGWTASVANFQQAAAGGTNNHSKGVVF